MTYQVDVTASVSISDFVDACGLHELLTELDIDDVLAEIDEDAVVSYVATNYDHSVLREIDDGNICSYISSNVAMSELLYNLDDGDKDELRSLLNDGAQSAFTQDELVAIRDALTLVRSARAALLTSNTKDETLSNALEGVNRLIK